MRNERFATGQGVVSYWVDDAAGSTAPWLVFLPGLTADHTLFDAQMLHFSGKANCLVWDAPAHGASRPYPLSFTLDDCAQILRGILVAEGIVCGNPDSEDAASTAGQRAAGELGDRSFEIEPCAPAASRFILVGQSLGGYIAQVYMELFPGEVAGFVSIDSSTLKREYYPNWEVAFLRHTKGMYRSIPWAILKPWAVAGVATSQRGRVNMRAFMDSYDKREYVDLAAFGYRLLADALDSRREYAIDCPALLLCGEKDHAGDVKKFNHAWSTGEGLPLVWVPGAGHNANVDAPAFVNDQIERFIALL